MTTFDTNNTDIDKGRENATPLTTVPSCNHDKNHDKLECFSTFAVGGRVLGVSVFHGEVRVPRPRLLDYTRPQSESAAILSLISLIGPWLSSA